RTGAAQRWHGGDCLGSRAARRQITSGIIGADAHSGDDRASNDTCCVRGRITQFALRTHAVNCVTGQQATRYAAFVSRRDGLSSRLPRCDEWERAARSGKSRFAWGDAWPGARCNGCDAACPKGWRQADRDDGLAHYRAERSLAKLSRPRGAIQSRWQCRRMVHRRHEWFQVRCARWLLAAARTVHGSSHAGSL
ncbi:MAG: SUMF1/EgtB/PvdO family nonheme iron enzyme, partial [Rhodospirillaceae bacterium]|nr:SUMF1/EgtB/PvdO family nonheme iron enzyme [Rhodospirillaceae bacterium]